MLHVLLSEGHVISVNNSSQMRRKYIPVYAYQYMKSPLKAEGRERRKAYFHYKWDQEHKSSITRMHLLGTF